MDLNKNFINRIRRGDFSNMLYLKELGINNMFELIFIDSFVVDNLLDLRKIEVINNFRLFYIYFNVFFRLFKLELFMFNSNVFSVLYYGIIEFLFNFKEISIYSNFIRCDCVIRWINMNKINIRFMELDLLFCVDLFEF